MLGLLEKDLRLTLTRKQTLVIFFVVALIMGISMDGSFIVAYLTMLATILAVGTISYDEFDNGFAFLMTLPFSRKTYVREKYLFSLLLAGAAWCVGAILFCVVSGIRHDTASLKEALPMLVAILPVMYLTAAVMIPLQLKYGAEKSRIVLLIFFGIIAILIFGSKRIYEDSNALAELTKALEGITPAVVLLALAAGCAVITCVSYLWSVHIMEKKEF